MSLSQAIRKRKQDTGESGRAIARALGVAESTVRRALKGLEVNEKLVQVRGAADTDTEDGSVPLIACEAVLTKRPNDDTYKAAFNALQEGRAYPVSNLATKLGVAEDTLVHHARRLGVLRYVELPGHPGQYKRCVLHPKTAESYGG